MKYHRMLKFATIFNLFGSRLFVKLFHCNGIILIKDYLV
jgi:hypothetical protein